MIFFTAFFVVYIVRATFIELNMLRNEFVRELLSRSKLNLELGMVSNKIVKKRLKFLLVKVDWVQG